MQKNQIKNRKTLLIINADDYAYNPQTDRAILQLLLKGKLKSLSVLINGPNIIPSAHAIIQFAQQNPQIYLDCSIGLHFNLTEGRPFNKDLEGSELVEKGLFRGKAAFYEQIAKSNHKVDGFIEAQAHLQINQFIRVFKRRPSHIDGHNHVHLVPKIASILATVMQQYGIYRVRTLNQDIQAINIPMNTIFLKNNQISKHFYEERGIISSMRFVGLESFGNLSQKQITETFQKLKAQKYKTVELMCHPGYIDELGSSWSASLDREKEKKQLQSSEFEQLADKYGLCSYLDLFCLEADFRPKILIYSKLFRGTGNQTTAFRLKQMFEKLGYQVYLWNASDDLDVETESNDLYKFLVTFGITLVFGINVSRSAIIISKATSRFKVPYVLMVAGTDANITFKDHVLVSQYYQALRDSQSLISLSRYMAQITEKTLKRFNLAKKIHLIVQSSCLSSELKPQLKWSKPQKPYILLPTSFRKVKCVHHLFKELNELISSFDFQVFIAGPIIDHQYYKSCLPHLDKISYLGTLSKPLYAQYLKNAYIMINTSQSEGMSCSILQAFEFGIPVIARNNSGNLELINHMYNGLVYEKPEDFTNLVELLQNHSLREKLIANGKSLFQQKYSCNSEIQAYSTLLTQIYHSNIYTYSLGQQWIKVLNQPHIHSTSEINNLLFQQIKPKLQPHSVLLDMCCGNGIFSLIVMLTQAEEIDLYLVDISFEIAALAAYNYRQSSVWRKLRKITYLDSNLFQYVPEITYHTILINPPQTPFRKPQSRLDKNGGTLAIKFYQPLLHYFSHHPGKLYLYHSYMANPQNLSNLMKEYQLKITWSSTIEVHEISGDVYNQMQQNLEEYILQHMGKGRANIVYRDGVFYVPAVIYCLQPV